MNTQEEVEINSNRASSLKYYNLNKERVNQEKVKRRILRGEGVRPATILKHNLLDFVEEHNPTLYNKCAENIGDYKKQVETQDKLKDVFRKNPESSDDEEGVDMWSSIEYDINAENSCLPETNKKTIATLRRFSKQLGYQNNPFKAFRDYKKVIKLDRELHPPAVGVHSDNMKALRVATNSSEEFRKAIGKRASKFYIETHVKARKKESSVEESIRKAAEPVKNWGEFKKAIEKFSNEKPTDEMGILLSLYLEYPARDDYGDVKLVKSKPEATKLMKEEPSVNYYNVSNGKLSLGHFKTVGDFGRVEFKLSDPLKRRIKSMIHERRIHMEKAGVPVQNKLFILGKGNKLSDIMRGVTFALTGMSMSINEMRHSRITYAYNVEKLSKLDRIALAGKMLHSEATQALVYRGDKV